MSIENDLLEARFQGFALAEVGCELEIFEAKRKQSLEAEQDKDYWDKEIAQHKATLDFVRTELKSLARKLEKSNSGR